MCKFGYTGDRFNCSAVRNLALGKPASQLSTVKFASYNYAAFRGNDGDKFTDAMTNVEVNPWWQVDLGASAHILRVSIKPNFSFDITIHVGHDSRSGGINNTPCGASVEVESIKFSEFVCPIGMVGRYVSVHVKGIGQLGLYEVEVYGVLPRAP
eukprot:Seg1970.3 transcript_id=Seg1970.3/GoldUCD/mRNA.D3Y31 product="Epidermal growth factor-like protein 6" protein_id=Seg1970.3/GoldUCD/D3Y31